MGLLDILPEKETKELIRELTGAAQDLRATLQRVNRLLDRVDTATTSAAAGWQVPPRG